MTCTRDENAHDLAFEEPKHRAAFADLMHIVSDLCIGPRNTLANTSFSGQLMLADKETWTQLRSDAGFIFPKAGDVGYCVVGDDGGELSASRTIFSPDR